MLKRLPRRPLLARCLLLLVCVAAAAFDGPVVNAGAPPDEQASSQRSDSTRFVLVTRGKPSCMIVIPDNATAIDRRAAEILQSSVTKISGAVLPILAKPKPGARGEFVIGFPRASVPASVARAAARLREDGFVVASTGRNVYVLSGGHKGSIYGVVQVLEKYFGCRKFSPTFDLFPPRTTLALAPMTEIENPANDFRAVYGEFARDADYRDWLRIDVVDDVFGRDYYVHTFGRLVPPDTYFAAHPDYFALMNGKRIKDQLCPSRPEVLEIAVAQLKEAMAAQPDRRVWSVSQNDNFSYCQCDECRRVIAEEGSPAGPIIRFVNAVAARVPGKIISTLAYQYSRQAPRVTRPAPNVQIMLCTIELNRSLPIAEDPGSRSFLRDIVDWGKISSNIYLWDYTVNFSHHVSPFPNLHVLQPNIQFFVRNGARQHFQQTNTSPGHEFSELKSYLLARLLWNPNADVPALTTEFLRGYYGAAAPFIRQYIDALKTALMRTGAHLDIYEPPVSHADTYLSVEDVARYNALFDRAETAAAGETAMLGHVRTARLPLQYAMLEIGKNDMFGPRGFYVQREGRFELRPEMKTLVDSFYATCEKNGVRTLNEAGLTPKAYYDATLRFLDVQVDGNLAFRKRVVAEPAPAAKYGKGDVALLTNGVRGANDFKVHWLGWEGLDFDLTLDLEKAASPRTASLGTLWDAKSWILHPRRVTCLVSADGTRYQEIGTRVVEGDQRAEQVTRTFAFDLPASASGIRFVRFHVEGTRQLPAWHPSSGGMSWVFVDEVVVR